MKRTKVVVVVLLAILLVAGVAGKAAYDHKQTEDRKHAEEAQRQADLDLVQQGRNPADGGHPLYCEMWRDTTLTDRLTEWTVDQTFAQNSAFFVVGESMHGDVLTGAQAVQGIVALVAQGQPVPPEQYSEALTKAEAGDRVAAVECA